MPGSIYFYLCWHNNRKVLEEFLKEDCLVPILCGFEVITMCGDAETIKLVWEIEKTFKNNKCCDIAECFINACIHLNPKAVKTIMELCDIDQQLLNSGFDKASYWDNIEVIDYLSNITN